MWFAKGFTPPPPKHAQGSAYSVAYSDVTFFLADEEAVDRFIANPEEEIRPVSIKATQLCERFA